MLDEDYEWFPHVTHSKTGLTNVEEILHKTGLSDVDVYYITRSYLTRHGNGPIPFESTSTKYTNITDDTNFTNHFQGELRFAPLNIKLLVKSVKDDIMNSDLTVNSSLVITHFGSLPNNEFVYYSNRISSDTTPTKLLEELSNYTTWSNILTFNTKYIDSVNTLEYLM